MVVAVKAYHALSLRKPSIIAKKGELFCRVEHAKLTKLYTYIHVALMNYYERIVYLLLSFDEFFSVIRQRNEDLIFLARLCGTRWKAGVANRVLLEANHS